MPGDDPVTVPDITLDQLCARSLAGDRAAETALFSDLRVRFLGIAKRRVQQDHLEDVVQDTLKIVCDRYGERKPGPGILVWSLTVLRNVIGNHYQARSRERGRLDFVEELPAAAAAEPDALAGAVLTETRRNLERAIEEVAARFPRCGTILGHLLRSLDRGGSPQEISTRALGAVQREEPDMSRGGFYTALHRCRGRLRDVLVRLEEGASHG